MLNIYIVINKSKLIYHFSADRDNKKGLLIHAKLYLIIEVNF